MPSLVFGAVHLARTSSQWIATSGYAPTGSESIVFWGYMDSLPTAFADSFLSGPNCNFMFGMDNPSNKPVSYVYKDNVCVSNNQLIANNALNANTWYCFYYAEDTSTGIQAIRVFGTDFSLASSGSVTTSTGARGTNGTSWGIGLQGAGGNFWNGRLRSMAVSDVGSLTDQQIQAICSSSNPALHSPVTLSHYWPLVDGSDARELVSHTSSSVQAAPTYSPNSPLTPFDY